MFISKAGSWVICLALVLPVSAENAPPIMLAKGDLTALSLEELSNLEITSVSKSPEKLLKAAAAIYVITQDDIRRSGVTSIPEALRLAPGVDVARINSNQWAIGIRGFGDRLSRSVLVMIDGRAVYSPLFAGTYWEIQDYPLMDIDRIEVIRGPGGTMWGANAFNGVINIITKNSKDTQGGYVTGGGGTEERGFGTARFGGKVNEDFNYRVYGKYFDRDASFHTNGDNYDSWNMGQGGFRTDWDLSERDSLTMQGDLYKGQTGSQVAIAQYSAPYSYTLTQDADVFGANLLGRWKRVFDSTSDMAVKWYYDRTNREDLNFTEQRDTVDLDFQHRFGLFGRQEVTWGAEYRLTSNRITSVPVIVFDPADRTDQLGTGFLQDKIALVPERLDLTVGIKVEHNDYSGWEEEPSGRLAWTPTERQTFWTAVSYAVATPSQVDQDLTATLPGIPFPPFGALFPRQVGNKNFQSEKLTAYEFGYRVQPVDPLFFDAAAFYNQYDDLLTGEFGAPFFQTTPAPALILPVTLGNKMSGETHGLELASTWNALSWWRWRANYSLLLVHLKLDPDSTDITNRPETVANSSPRHQAVLQWSLDLPYNLEFDPTARYQNVMSELGIPTYWNLDMRLAWHATPRLEIALVGQNLLQPQHPEQNTAQQIQRGGYGQVTWKW